MLGDFGHGRGPDAIPVPGKMLEQLNKGALTHAKPPRVDAVKGQNAPLTPRQGAQRSSKSSPRGQT